MNDVVMKHSGSHSGSSVKSPLPTPHTTQTPKKKSAQNKDNINFPEFIDYHSSTTNEDGSTRQFTKPLQC